jgi:hypothetical protein
MRIRRFVPAVLIAAALMLAAGMTLTGLTTNAQTESTPTMGTMGMETPHPAHIHSGTCDTLGDVVYPLNNVESPGMASPMAGMDMTPMAGMMASPTSEMGAVVATSTTTVQVALNDLLGGQFAINVHESADNIQNYIACGNVTGTATDNKLQVKLNELNNSGYEGQAWLMDNGNGTTTVMVVLTHTMGAMATPTS